MPGTEYSQAKPVGLRKGAEAAKLFFENPRSYWIVSARVMVAGKSTERAIIPPFCAKKLPYIDLDYCQFSDWDLFLNCLISVLCKISIACL